MLLKLVHIREVTPQNSAESPKDLLTKTDVERTQFRILRHVQSETKSGNAGGILVFFRSYIGHSAFNVVYLRI
jgi:hypothetical protein